MNLYPSGMKSAALVPLDRRCALLFRSTQFCSLMTNNPCARDRVKGQKQTDAGKSWRAFLRQASSLQRSEDHQSHYSERNTPLRNFRSWIWRIRPLNFHKSPALSLENKMRTISLTCSFSRLVRSSLRSTHSGTGITLIENLPERTRCNAWSDFDSKVRASRRDSKSHIASLSDTERVEVRTLFVGARHKLPESC